MLGAISLWSRAEFIRQRKGFLMTLDIYRAYDRVCLSNVHKVLDTMGFGNILREVVATLIRGATASFLLHQITLALSITFSVRQGELLHILQLQPFLFQLEDALPRLCLPDFEERVEPMWMTWWWWENIKGLLYHRCRCRRQYEAVSGAILNRSHKTVVSGLGGWAGRRE
jgi:hypothetical protein